MSPTSGISENILLSVESGVNVPPDLQHARPEIELAEHGCADQRPLDGGVVQNELSVAYRKRRSQRVELELFAHDVAARRGGSFIARQDSAR